MRDGVAGLGLLKASFDFRQEVESLDRVFHSCVFRKILNGSHDVLFHLWRFHVAPSLTQRPSNTQLQIKHVMPRDDPYDAAILFNQNRGAGL
jgi:hypothetical protein